MFREEGERKWYFTDPKGVNAATGEKISAEDLRRSNNTCHKKWSSSFCGFY